MGEHTYRNRDYCLVNQVVKVRKIYDLPREVLEVEKTQCEKRLTPRSQQRL